jgi:hypothetical protein
MGDDRRISVKSRTLGRIAGNDVLVTLDSLFTKIYADGGRPSIPPERLLRALLLSPMAFAAPVAADVKGQSRRDPPSSLRQHRRYGGRLGCRRGESIWSVLPLKPPPAALDWPGTRVAFQVLTVH